MSSVLYHPEVEKAEHDAALKAKRVILYGWDGDNLVPVKVSVNSDGELVVSKKNETSVIVVSGDYTYICKAPVGTAEASAAWSCKRIDGSVSGTTKIKWADGDDSYDNVATDPTALSYS